MTHLNHAVNGVKSKAREGRERVLVVVDVLQ